MDNRNLENFYDAVIIGGGPAGLSSAIYMARAKYRTLVLEQEKFGGQITITSEVVNYPGVFKTSGEELTKEMQKQAESFGAEFLLCQASEFESNGDYYTITTDRGNFDTLGLIIASGASPRMVGFEGEDVFKGRGVAYCATCDGEFFTGKDIFVIGSGFAACEEGLFLTRFAKKVHMLIRGDDFSCTGSIVNEVKENESIEIYYNTTVNKVYGENFVQGISVNSSGKDIDFFTKEGIGVFVFAGYQPASEIFADKIALNEQKYIITDENQKTNLDGVYAAGDICIKNLRQVVTAVSDGATAATSLEKYVASKYENLGLPKREYEKKIVNHTKEKVNSENDDRFLSQEIVESLMPVFERFESDLILKYRLDDSEVSKEVQGFINEFSKVTPRVICQKDNELQNELPCISIFTQNGKSKNVSFHGVPGGHEFNSFIIGLYNAQGEGQKISAEVLQRINSIQSKINIKLAVTLSCTNCPDLVIATEKIALLNDNITLDIYDLSQFEDLKSKHNIMSVPCMIINEEQIHFGKKSIDKILDLLEKI